MIREKADQKSRYTSLTPAVEQAAEIIKHIASNPKKKLTCTEISKAVGINLSKTYVVLDALQKSAFVSKEKDGKLYSLGLGLISVGQVALERANYHDAVRPFLVEVAGETSCTALFQLIAGDNIVVTAAEASGRAVESRLKLGHSRPLYYRSSGRIIAAYMPKEEQELLIKSKKHAFYAKNAKFSNDDVRRDLEICRKNGFANQTLDEEPYGMINAIASAVLDVTNSPIGCFLAIGLFPEASAATYGPKVAEVARRFSAYLGANMAAGQ